jgi:hypothetical protein
VEYDVLAVDVASECGPPTQPEALWLLLVDLAVPQPQLDCVKRALVAAVAACPSDRRVGEKR